MNLQANILEVLTKNNQWGIFVCNEELKINFWSSSVQTIFQLSESQALGKRLSEIHPYFANAEIEAQIKQVFLGESIKLPPIHLNYSKSDTYTHQIKLSPFQQDAQSGSNILGIIETIPEKQQIFKQEKLETKENHLQLPALDLQNQYDLLQEIIERIPTSIQVIDNQFCYLAFNQAFFVQIKELLGIEVKLGNKVIDLYDNFPELKKSSLEHWQRALQGEEFSIEYNYPDNKGNLTYHEVSYQTIKNKSGEFIGAVSLSRNITDSKNALNNLKNTLKRLTLINTISQEITMDASAEQIIQNTVNHLWNYFKKYRVAYSVIDENDILHILYAQQPLNMDNLNGLSVNISQHQELLDRFKNLQINSVYNALDAYTPKSGQKILEYGTQATLDVPLQLFNKFAGLLSFHAPFSKNWTDYEVETLSHVADFLEIALKQAYLNEERRKATEALKKSQQQTEALINAVPDMIIRVKNEGTVIDFKKNLEETPAIPRIEIGKNLQESGLSGKLKTVFKKLIQQAILNNEIKLYEYTLRQMGEKRVYETRIVKSSEDEAVFIVRDITKQKQREKTIEFLLKNEILINQQLAKKNEFLARKEAELEKANQEQKIEQRKLERTLKALNQSRLKLKSTLADLESRNFELDQFVYKTSHDLRAPLTSILGLINLSKEEADIQKVKDYIALMENRVLKLDGFILSMLNFSRNARAELSTESIDFEQVIKECFADLSHIKHFFRLEKHLTIVGKENAFYSDGIRIKIIFLNLISNAIKYQNINLEKSQLRIDIELKPEFARIVIWDNGIGIHKEYLNRVFDMFFRATEKSDGSGLGMYIVKQTIEKLKGSVKINSTFGKGTKVFIKLMNFNQPTPS